MAIRLLAGIIGALCIGLALVTSHVLVLTGPAPFVQAAVDAVLAQDTIVVVLTATPLLLMVLGVVMGLRPSLAVMVLWLFYAYFAWMVYVGAVKLATEPLYLNPFILPAAGCAMILLAGGKREPVATPAPVTGGPVMPAGPAPERGGGTRGR